MTNDELREIRSICRKEIADFFVLLDRVDDEAHNPREPEDVARDRMRAAVKAWAIELDQDQE